MSNPVKKVTPQKLYHRVWELIPKTFWFQERLQGWSDWEHRFDSELVTDADAFRCVNIMLSSLNEMYTELLEPKPDDDDVVHPPCCSAVMLPNRIGHFKITTFKHPAAASQIRRTLATITEARGFIVDLRGNTGGSVALANMALDAFMDEGGTYTLKERKPDVGYFEAVCRLEAKGFFEEASYKNKKTKKFSWARYRNLTGKKPMVILINGRTASASELFAGILRDCQRGTLIGTRSFGKGIAQNTYIVGNGYRLVVTDGVFLPPSGQFFGDHQQTVYDGIVPHMTVPAVEGSDNQLDAAIDHLARALKLRGSTRRKSIRNVESERACA